MRISPTCIRLFALVAISMPSGRDLVAQTRGGMQYRPPVFHAAGVPASRPVQALFVTPLGSGAANPYVDAYGNRVVVPAGYCASCEGGCADCVGPDYVGQNPAPYGCDGCSSCNMGTYPPFEDDVENYSLLRPFRTEQCGPHYFDVRMEAVFLTRDETFNQQVDFTSDGFIPNPIQIVLQSDQLDFDTEAGFRVVGRYDVGALSVIEFGYMGLESLDASASFTDDDPVDADTGDLYSLFSDFGNAAVMPAGINTQDSGVFPATERSITQSITLETELHVAEISYRRYWVGYSPCVSGTLLCGFRFTRLREDFDFSASGEADGRYLVLAKNDLAGFQAGGDMWVRLLRGLRAGVEGKLGVYDNHYTLDNSFTSTDPAQDGVFAEHFEKDVPAFIGEASVDVVADLTPSWSLRAGYEVHYLNSLVLAGENFNTGSIYSGEPGVLLPPRVPFVDDQGEAFYHGAHVGAEFIW